MQRTRRTPLSDSDSTRQPAEEQTEPADPTSAGSSSSPDPTSAAAATPAAEAGESHPDDADLTEPTTADAATDDAAKDPDASDDGASAGGVAPGGRSWRLTAVFAVVGLVVLGLDQLTKVLALHHLTPGEPVDVIGTFLRFNLIRNPGAAFSLGSDFTPVISTIQIVVAVAVIWFSRRLGSLGWAVAFGFLFGGAVGNITDRVFREPSPFHGHVVDFLQLPHWAIFNIADMAVTSAAILLIVQTLRGIRLDGTREVAKK
ncbi:signal peptidase II [Kribbella amoyensis]|uniref:Lipoprotein signal peptidase n=1 Tax=Kribbella amoyensis TaxID=996641 RepID=A0A561BXP9_9ACTN|nr:signal peptidase II [Kribbella amoyensis]TWD83502.1 signal peptidase II [Kribbella amoyensis]